MFLDKTNARIRTSVAVLCACLIGTACTTATYLDATGSTDVIDAAVLWHPGLSVERVDQLTVSSPALIAPDRSRIAPGMRRIHAVRNGYITVMHGQADFKAGRIYYAHQNLTRGRLEIIELPDDFNLPQRSGPLGNADYTEAVRQAERIHRDGIIPRVSSRADESK